MLTMTNDDDTKKIMKTIAQLIRTLTHDLSTPLVAIKLGAHATNRYLPQLIDGYLLAKNNNLNVAPIQLRDLEILSRTIDNIENEARDALVHLNELIESLQAIEKNLCNFTASFFNEG
jgi:signal transduction histidine kinase